MMVIGMSEFPHANFDVNRLENSPLAAAIKLMVKHLILH